MFKHVKKQAMLLSILVSASSAHAISTEGAELSNQFISPFDKPTSAQTINYFDGASIRFKSTDLPSGGNSNQSYDWGIDLSTTGLPTTCNEQRIFAAFRSDGQGKRSFVVSSNSNNTSCDTEQVLHNFNWNHNEWYELKLTRDSYPTDRTSLWTISVKSLDNPSQANSFRATVIAKNQVSDTNIVSRLKGSQCSDSDWRVEWSKPKGLIYQQAFQIGRANFGLGEGACGKSTQDLLSTCGLHWSHQMGGHAQRPTGTYAYPDIIKEPMNCRETASGVGVLIAQAYVNAIAGGDATAVAWSPIDFNTFGCNSETVWKDECQSKAFNGLGGKNFMMNAITPVASADDWQKSNVKKIVPEQLMKRIMTDAKYSKAKTMFGYVSDPNNNWFPWLAGSGQAKEVLRRYMDSIK